MCIYVYVYHTYSLTVVSFGLANVPVPWFLDLFLEAVKSLGKITYVISEECHKIASLKLSQASTGGSDEFRYSVAACVSFSFLTLWSWRQGHVWCSCWQSTVCGAFAGARVILY